MYVFDVSAHVCLLCTEETRERLLFYHSPPYSLETEFSQIWSQKAPAILLPPWCCSCRGMQPGLVFYMRTGDLNSGPYVYVASIIIHWAISSALLFFFKVKGDPKLLILQHLPLSAGVTGTSQHFYPVVRTGPRAPCTLRRYSANCPIAQALRLLIIPNAMLWN